MAEGGKTRTIHLELQAAYIEYCSIEKLVYRTGKKYSIYDNIKNG